MAEGRDTKRKRINIMKIIQKIGILSVAFCLMAGFAQAAGKSSRPDATLHLHSGSVAAGVGISWGKGTLTYKGHFEFGYLHKTFFFFLEILYSIL